MRHELTGCASVIGDVVGRHIAKSAGWANAGASPRVVTAHYARGNIPGRVQTDDGIPAGVEDASVLIGQQPPQVPTSVG